MNFEYCMVYVTTKNGEEARKIAKKVLDVRLAACANIVDSVESCYHWKGSLEEDQESLLILKTRIIHYKDLEREIKANHSYEVPCILAYPVLEGNPEYLEWIRNETARS